MADINNTKTLSAFLCKFESYPLQKPELFTGSICGKSVCGTYTTLFSLRNIIFFYSQVAKNMKDAKIIIIIKNHQKSLLVSSK